MNEITIKPFGDKWGAFAEEKCLFTSACKNCIVKVFLDFIGRSKRYKTLIIEDADGKVARRFLRGEINGRTGSTTV